MVGKSKRIINIHYCKISLLLMSLTPFDATAPLKLAYKKFMVLISYPHTRHELKKVCIIDFENHFEPCFTSERK